MAKWLKNPNSFATPSQEAQQGQRSNGKEINWKKRAKTGVSAFHQAV